MAPLIQNNVFSGISAGENEAGIFQQSGVNPDDIPILDHPAFIAAAERAIWNPPDYFQRAARTDVFERLAPLELDLGCGDGGFIVGMAERHPDRDFLGTERLMGRVEKVSRKIARRELRNCRILRLESKYAILNLLPPGCADVVHIGFPDPWPKRQHHPRRLFQDDFMVALHQVVTPSGEIRIKTDDEPYFRWIEKVVERASGFEQIEWIEETDYPKTDFEMHFTEQGLPTYRVRLRKLS